MTEEKERDSRNISLPASQPASSSNKTHPATRKIPWHGREKNEEKIKHPNKRKTERHKNPVVEDVEVDEARGRRAHAENLGWGPKEARADGTSSECSENTNNEARVCPRLTAVMTTSGL